MADTNFNIVGIEALRAFRTLQVEAEKLRVIFEAIAIAEKERQKARTNRKWQRIFAGLIILNAIIWYNITTY